MRIFSQMKKKLIIPFLFGIAFAMSALSAISQEMALGTDAAQNTKPNVLVWMLDDVGFAQLSSYGGIVETPNIDRVAEQGLRYANFHTTPICSSSRASLLSGRNSHSVHVGGHAASSRPFPGYDAHIPASAGSIADNLHEAGYRTYALGKWDHLPTEDATPAGPFNQWPAGQGFDHFYGFLAADADNWNPILIRDLSPVARPNTPDYHLNNDLADEAITLIRTRDGQFPTSPFFMYWATGTAHAPHHAPKQWIDRYKGKFDMGWDKVREMILTEQKAENLVPKDTQLAPRPEGMPAWESLSSAQKKLYARQMEVFAAAMSHADEQFGRILDALDRRGELDNTIIIVTSDNGASAEGAYDGLFNEAALVTGKYPNVEENLAFYDRWGGPETYPHYSFGWAVAGNTPFRYYKQTAHEGGIHVPLVVAWPEGITARGEIRHQFVHVSDIAPTILDAVGVKLADYVNNVKQDAMEGESFSYSFDSPDAADIKQAQYFEMYGNKSLWSKGWSIVTTHRFKTWELMSVAPPNEPWELYDLTRDPGQTRDLASQYPKKVAEMDRLFDEQARRYNVYPIGSIAEGGKEAYRKAAMAFMERKGKWLFSGSVGNISNMASPPITTLSFDITATLELPEQPVTGPIFASGGQLGGMGLYLRDNKPVFLFNSLAGESSEVAAAERLPHGTTQLEFSFANGSPGHQSPADHLVVIRADGKVVAEGTLHVELPRAFGISETFGVGIDNGSPVLAGAPTDVPFAGKITDVSFKFPLTPPGDSDFQ